MDGNAEDALLPIWLARRLPYLRQTGTIRISGESDLDLHYFSHPQVVGALYLVKLLDISRTPLTTLAGCPDFPRLTVFIADHSQLANFASFRALRNVTSFSLKDTPVSKGPTYKLSLLLVVGTESMRSIDGGQICSALKANYERFPPICQELANAGWIASTRPPSSAEIRSLCSQYSIDEPLFQVASEDGDLVSFTRDDSTSDTTLDFDGLLKKLRGEHKEVWRKGQAQFGIVEEGTAEVDESGKLASDIAEVMRRHGIDGDLYTDDGLLETVEGLFSRSPR
jgi:hypothetical protein